MKRQLNYWSKSFGLPESELVNVSLSIEDKQFTVVFRRPGSVKPITQVAIDINSDEEIFNLKYAFESSGCQIFQDEMDERIYFSKIVMQREEAKQAEKFVVCVGWSVIFYIICMAIGAFLIKLPIILSLLLSIPLAILCGTLIRNKFYNETKTSDGS
jgi:hypothetical protein